MCLWCSQPDLLSAWIKRHISTPRQVKYYTGRLKTWLRRKNERRAFGVMMENPSKASSIIIHVEQGRQSCNPSISGSPLTGKILKFNGWLKLLFQVFRRVQKLANDVQFYEFAWISIKVHSNEKAGGISSRPSQPCCFKNGSDKFPQ